MITASLGLNTAAYSASLWDSCASLIGRLSGLTSKAEEDFKRFYESGDAQGWKKLIDETVNEIGGLVGLGGNDSNTHSVTLTDGTSVVTKEFFSAPLEHHKKILDQLTQWEKDGKGPRVIGVSLLPGLKPSERKFFVVMEDLRAKRNEFGRTLTSGNGRDVGILQSEPQEARRWLMERMLSLLETHSDPHPMNVVFRVTQLNRTSLLPPEGTYYLFGGRLYQAFLIDPSGATGNPKDPIFNTPLQQTPQPLLQYNHEWKRKYFQKALGLQ